MDWYLWQSRIREKAGFEMCYERKISKTLYWVDVRDRREWKIREDFSNRVMIINFLWWDRWLEEHVRMEGLTQQFNTVHVMFKVPTRYLNNDSKLAGGYIRMYFREVWSKDIILGLINVWYLYSLLNVWLCFWGEWRKKKGEYKAMINSNLEATKKRSQ